MSDVTGCEHLVGLVDVGGSCVMVYSEFDKRDNDKPVIRFAYCPNCGKKLMKSFGPDNMDTWFGSHNHSKPVNLQKEATNG